MIGLCRSFQDVGRTYSQVAEQVCSEYGGGAAICTVGEDKTLERPVIQYRETDWEFLMRMASHCGGVLVPETHRGLPRLWFGFPDRSFTCQFPEDAYTSGISQRYYELGGSAAGYSKTDFFYYDVESPQLCDLGWYTVFKGEPFLIAEKSAILERGELIFTYRLGRPGLGWGKTLYNEKISGMTLLGEVLETSRETLKLKLDIDAGWDPGGPYPYTWRPETGNFMYCMPQVGTRVSLYCPNYDEKAAIAVNCVRTNGGECERMGDPAKRSFVTEHGKEMNLYPEEMFLLGGSNGLIDLSDENGITISSEKPVAIIANEEITLEAAQVVTQALVGEIVAAKGVPVTGDVESSFMMSNNYDAVAESITGAEGWNCVAYEPYDDAPQEAGFDWGGLAFAVIGMIAAAVVVGFLGISGIGAFVIAGLVAGAVTGALNAGRAALNAGLTGADFWAAVGLGALVGGVQGAISGLISFGVFSGVAAAFCTTIAQLGFLKTMLAGGLSGGVISAGSQLLYTGGIDPWQVLGDTVFSSILTGTFYTAQNIRGFWGTDANGLRHAGIGDNQTGHGFLFGQSGGSVGGIYMNGTTPVKGVAYIPGRGVVWAPQAGSVPNVPMVQNTGVGALVPTGVNTTPTMIPVFAAPLNSNTLTKGLLSLPPTHQAPPRFPVIRSANSKTDASFLQGVNDARSLLSGKLRNVRNFGYAETDILAIEDKRFAAHSKVRFGLAQRVAEAFTENQIQFALQPENQQFFTLKVNSENIIDGEGAWDRIVDAEAKIIEAIAQQLGEYTQAPGKITLYTDYPPCPSCQYVIRQFMSKYPNIKVEVIYSGGKN